MSDPLVVPARDGIEAQRGHNDIFPGDPYPARDQLKRGLDALRAHASGRGRITSLEVYALTDPLMDILERCVPVASTALASARPEGWHPTYRHKKRGTTYRVIGEARVQCDMALKDMAHVVVYEGEDGAKWVRPTAEFDDGRFEEIAVPPSRLSR